MARRRERDGRRCSLADLEVAHPAELGELGLVGVEHEQAGVREAHLADSALALHLGDGVGELGGLKARAGREVVEEVAVQVERVDRVVLQDVDEVDPHQLAALDLHGLVVVVERNAVDRVELVALRVEVGVVAVLDHDHLIGVRAPIARVDDERPVHAARDVLGQRPRVAVVEVQPERLGVELIRRALAGLDEARPLPGNPVHV